MSDHRHYLDSKTLRCAICDKPADQCKAEQGRVAVAMSQRVPSNRVGNRVFLHGHEVISDTGAGSELTPAGRTIVTRPLTANR